MSVVTVRLMDALGSMAGAVPRPVALAGGRRLGDLMSLLVRSRRRLVLSNLERAYGDALTPSGRRRLMRQVFRHFGETLVETLLLPRMVREGLERFVSHEGWEHLERALAQRKGVLAFTAHLGNWEMTALSLGARGVPVDAVGRPPSDPELARRLDAARRLTGNRTISKRNAARPILQSLRDGRVVGLVVDQNVGANRGVFVDFFGQPASTTPALAVFALKTGAPVIPVFDHAEAGRHRVVIGPPLEIHPTGRTERDVLTITAAATTIVEEKIRAHPHQWLWMHNRWRSRPPSEESA
jgi:KDO2-lipid IV(A) lauroyltransferase